MLEGMHYPTTIHPQSRAKRALRSHHRRAQEANETRRQPNASPAARGRLRHGLRYWKIWKAPHPSIDSRSNFTTQVNQHISITRALRPLHGSGGTAACFARLATATGPLDVNDRCRESGLCLQKRLPVTRKAFRPEARMSADEAVCGCPDDQVRADGASSRIGRCHFEPRAG
jgi:hypothetical protein